MNAELTTCSSRIVREGKNYPLGASLTPEGVSFALYSQHASRVFLLLFDSPGGDPTDVIELKERTKLIWHGLVHGIKAGQLYAYKVDGDYNPASGLRFNKNKLLLDPYAKALTGKCRNVDNLLLAYDPLSCAKDLAPDGRDNTQLMPKCIVIDDQFDWQGEGFVNLPLEELIIYEVHVKGFTAHPSSGVSRPGTYLGFIEKIPYLKDLGINAVEFLPVHEFYVDDFLLNRGLTNYWGYNTVSFFAPESSYSTQRFPGCQVNEFKTLVCELHRAGIAVILDVVYNHTGEGSELGPTLNLRGIDNLNYYALTGPPGEASRYYMNYTGTGNSVDLAKPAALRLVTDSLRYWVEAMHVDGFRFDLASVLGRSGDEMRFRRSASFFDSISQDPVLNRVVLIAEPWDLGTYEVGNFPVDWSEWNGRFRDTLRKFVKGDRGQIADLGWRLTGSADLYGEDGRSAYNSINFITCHDGFTLNDLVSYSFKHNESNGENSQDGTNENNSWNCGIEGPTSDPTVIQLRKQLIKNYACCLFFPCGTPMMLGGDEFMRTQQGNNNAYCQDNPISWFNWDDVEKNADVFSFFKRAIRFTREYPILQRRRFPLGVDLNANHIPDLEWFGFDLDTPNWHDPELKTLCYQLDGSEVPSDKGDYLLFLIFNSDYQVRAVKLPKPTRNTRWYRVIDTSLPFGQDFLDVGHEILIEPPDFYLANPYSTVLLLNR